MEGTPFDFLKSTQLDSRFESIFDLYVHWVKSLYVGRSNPNGPDVTSEYALTYLHGPAVTREYALTYLHALIHVYLLLLQTFVRLDDIDGGGEPGLDHTFVLGKRQRERC